MIDMTQQFININDFSKTERQAIIHLLDTGEILPVIKLLVPLLKKMSEEDLTILYHIILEKERK